MTYNIGESPEKAVTAAQTVVGTSRWMMTTIACRLAARVARPKHHLHSLLKLNS